MKWRGKPLRFWLDIIRERDETVEGLTYSFDCLISDLAYEMGKSREEWFKVYSADERAQLVATYRSKRNRDTVMAEFPVQVARRGQHGVS